MGPAHGNDWWIMICLSVYRKQLQTRTLGRIWLEILNQTSRNWGACYRPCPSISSIPGIQIDLVASGSADPWSLHQFLFWKPSSEMVGKTSCRRQFWDSLGMFGIICVFFDFLWYYIAISRRKDNGDPHPQDAEGKGYSYCTCQLIPPFHDLSEPIQESSWILWRFKTLFTCLFFSQPASASP